MLQTAFGASCMNRASVFELHKRFREGAERCGRSKEVNTPELIGQRVRVTVTSLRFQESPGRESVGRGQHSSNRVSSISTRTMHQSTTPSLSQTKMGIKTVPHPPYSPDLAPCDFWLFHKLRGCLYETIEEMKEADECHWHAHTRGLPWGLSEVVGTVQVHCSRGRLVRRGQEFRVCTINKSAHTKKVWKLI